MGARYLKAEEEAIRKYYPTATRSEIQIQVPGRTWTQISAHARRQGVRRITEAKGASIREGRRDLKNTYSNAENEQFDRIYPIATHTELFAAFPGRSLSAINSHAHRRNLHRTREARRRQMKIGREEARKDDKNK